MQWRSDLLLADRFEDLSREFLFPFVMYQDENQIVLANAEELERVFLQLRADQRRRGVVRMETRISAVDLPRHGRFRVWVDYADQDAQGRVIARSDAIFYFRQMPDGLKSEMAEYGRCALPELWIPAEAMRAAQQI